MKGRYIEDQYNKYCRYIKKRYNISIEKKRKLGIKKSLKHILLMKNIQSDLAHSESLKQLYFTETVSDILQAYVSLTLKQYKGTQMLLRSAIENYVKFAIDNYSSKGLEDFNSVFSLFEEFLKLDLDDKFSNYISFKGSLKQGYGFLCNYVHSTRIENCYGVEFINAIYKYDPEVEEEIVKWFVDIIYYIIVIQSNHSVYLLKIKSMRFFEHVLPHLKKIDKTDIINLSKKPRIYIEDI